MIIKANINPTLTKTICCHSCFYLGETQNAPNYCTYVPFPDKDSCGQELFKYRRSYHGTKDLGQYPSREATKNPRSAVVGVPTCYFVSQLILAWILRILLKPETEDAINEWANQLMNSTHLTNIQHGSAFKNLFDRSSNSNSLDLALSLFVDWFNPQGNKIGGSIESSGVFAFSLLNLPP
jgi:hypothetical protein